MKANVNDQDALGNTVSMIAVTQNDYNAVMILMEAKANVSRGTKYFTPLKIAMQHASFNIMQLLLKNKVNINVDDIANILHFIFTNKNLDLAKIIFDLYPHMNFDLIRYSIGFAENDFAKHILENANQNQLQHALNCAIQYKNLVMMGELLPRMSVVQRRIVQDFLTVVVKLGKIDLITKVIAVKANVNYDDGYDSVLFKASKFSHADTIKIILEAKADVSKASIHDETSLFAAIQKQERESVKVLLEAKADPNQPSREYHPSMLQGDALPPLYWAAKMGDIDIVKNIIESKANIKDSEKIDTIFRIAAQNGHIDVVEYLLECKANFNNINLNFENLLTEEPEISLKRSECIALIQDAMLCKKLEIGCWGKVSQLFFTPKVCVEPEEKKGLINKPG
jgi:ankyrin repeat protein